MTAESRRGMTATLHGRGFTLIEMAVVLAVLSLYVYMAMFYDPPQKSAAQHVESNLQQQIVDAVVAFAKKNLRLPCADTDGDGYEGEGTGCGSNAAEFVSGAVPFKTIELKLPSEVGSRLDKDFLYGVYRDGTIPLADGGGDLTQSDFTLALRNAALSAAGAGRLRTTGDGAQMGAVNCAGNYTNVAFAVAYSAGRDADLDGSLFDGVNSQSNWPGGGSTCFAAPTQAMGENYDDTVAAVGFNEMLAYVTQ